MTNEEKYAQLLSQSAIATALETKKRGIKANFKPSKKHEEPSVFDMISENKSYDVMVVIEEFAKLANTSKQEMLGYSRKLPLANARHVLFCVLHDILKLSNPQIGRIFKRDPTTVLYSAERGRQIVDNNEFIIGHINKVLATAKFKEE